MCSDMETGIEYKYIVLDYKENVCIVTVNREKNLNALNSEVLDELSNVFEELESNNSVKVIIITGAGKKAFVAGADISEMVSSIPSQAIHFARKGQNLVRYMENMKKPIIAAVNGFALGGGLELALGCDFIYASDNAKLGLPEVTLGIMPGFGGTQNLSRLIGANKAKELIFTGKMIGADNAHEWGIVNAVFSQEKLMDESLKTAKIISRNGLVAIGFAKEVISRGLNMSKGDAFKYESSIFSALFSTEDQKEGMNAFLEKRKPDFKNN